MAYQRPSKPNARLSIALVVAVALVLGGKVHADSAHDDSDLIQGTWNLIELNNGGNAVGTEDVGGTLEVAGTQATIKVKFPGDELYEKTYRFKLYPYREPKAFDVIWEDGRVTRGIYHLEGDTWYRCHGEPDGERPTTFDDLAVTGMIRSLWKRPEVKPREKPIP